MIIELSYWNMKAGLDKAISMTCWCPDHQSADDLYRRAMRLYKDSLVNGPNKGRTMDLFHAHVRFKPWKFVQSSDWMAFRGVHLIHPQLSSNFTKQKDFDLYDEMRFRNERYIDQWQV